MTLNCKVEVRRRERRCAKPIDRRCITGTPWWSTVSVDASERRLRVGTFGVRVSQPRRRAVVTSLVDDCKRQAATSHRHTSMRVMQNWLLVVWIATCISSGFTFKLIQTDGRPLSDSQSLNAESTDLRRHCRWLCSAVRIRLKRDYCVLTCELSPPTRPTVPDHIRRCAASQCSDFATTGYYRYTFSERYTNCVLERCIFLGVQRGSSITGGVRMVPSKRSWNDLAASCIEYKCPRDKPGSLMYIMCVQTNCNSAFIKR